MIAYKDIKKAINRQLSKTGVDINSSDVTEGFERPSFFVQLINPIRSANENQVHKAMTVQIYYFPSDRYENSIEVLDMQDQLEELFDLKLSVHDRLLDINELNTDLIDGVLNCSFDLEFYDGRNKEWKPEDEREFYEKYPSELMEELDFEKE